MRPLPVVGSTLNLTIRGWALALIAPPTGYLRYREAG